jgi:hypothetical protein
VLVQKQFHSLAGILRLIFRKKHEVINGQGLIQLHNFTISLRLAQRLTAEHKLLTVAIQPKEKQFIQDSAVGCRRSGITTRRTTSP